MTRLIAKLFSSDSKENMDALIAAYKAGTGAELLDHQREMASHEHLSADGYYRTNIVLFHAGLAIPAHAAKTAVLQHILVHEQGTVAQLQTYVDAALANALHKTVADGDTRVANKLTCASSHPFVTTDVGRKVQIGSVVRTIATYIDADNVTYTGDTFVSGTGKTVLILGAESIQKAHLSMLKSRSGTHRMHLLMALEGELPA